MTMYQMMYQMLLGMLEQRECAHSNVCDRTYGSLTNAGSGRHACVKQMAHKREHRCDVRARDGRCQDADTSVTRCMHLINSVPRRRR